MKCTRSICVACILATATCTSVTPIQKITALLNGMLEKGKKEKHDEEVQYAAQTQFCEDTTAVKVQAIKEETGTITTLTADINKYTADSTKLGKEVVKLDGDVVVDEDDITAATKVRGIEATDYVKTHEDYSESIDAIERALVVLKRQAQEQSFTQLSTKEVAALRKFSLIPAKAKQALTGFLQNVEADSDVDGDAAPEASEGVISMLEKLQEKFVDERSSLEKEEMNGKHSYGMLIQDRKAQIEQEQQDSNEKAQAKSKKLQSKASTKEDESAESALKTEDTEYLSDLTTDCKTKAAEFQRRQEMRAGEIEAIEKAIVIISSDSVSGISARRLPKLLQQRTSFGQLRANILSPSQRQATLYLQEQARQTSSRVLATVAQRMEQDPMGKVKKMLKDLVVRLMEEAAEEADHKGWCDQELGSNAQTRKEKSEAVDMLTAEIDEIKASLSELQEDIAELTKAVAASAQAMATATSIRSTEKTENEAAVEDAQEAQTAVAQALVVLKDFYSKAGAAAFLQMNQTSGVDGVIAMLEVIESDFARLEADTTASEVTAQKEYDSFMTDSKSDSTAKTTASEHKARKVQNQKQNLVEKDTDLEGTQKALDAALGYYDKLKPSCVSSGSDFEDRVARRKQEIESLQEGLRILNGEEIP